jgi:lactate dehydrogenase-like 2-hydroxyacid dehydrogenase
VSTVLAVHVKAFALIAEICARLRDTSVDVELLENHLSFVPDHPPASKANILLVSTGLQLDGAILSAMPDLHTIVFTATGTNSVDLDVATERGIVVARAQAPENAESMAEATIALILSLLYDVRRSERRLRDGWTAAPLPYANRLERKTIG